MPHYEHLQQPQHVAIGAGVAAAAARSIMHMGGAGQGGVAAAVLQPASTHLTVAVALCTLRAAGRRREAARCGEVRRRERCMHDTVLEAGA